MFHASFAVYVITTGLISCFPLHDEIINKDHTVIMFAFSGLRWDSMREKKLPALQHLAKHGVIGRRKIDAFQTESLPSFITMVTGVYSESHGIMANKMKNVESGELFDVRNTDPKWWNNVEPIWLTNAKNGSHSALCYWPGFDVEFEGNKTKYNCSKEHSVDPFRELTMKGTIHGDVMTFHERLEKVKTWLKLETDRPSFIGVYFEEPLKSAMKYGLKSNETKNAYNSINNITQDMINFLKKQNQFESMNFIVTGESGVTGVSESQQVFLQDNLKDSEKSTYHVIDDGPVMMIYPTKKSHQENLMKKWVHRQHITVYDGTKLSKSFHFSNKNRTAPIIIVADEGWRLYNDRVVDSKKALMGFDAKFSSSHAMFIAHGPAFNKGAEIDAMGNVDVYGMLCEALKIKSHAHCGNKTIIEKFIRKQEKWYVHIMKKVTSSATGLTLAIITAIVLLFIALFLVISAIYKTLGCCVCPKYPLKVNIKSPVKRLHSNHKGSGGQHLLSEEELSEASDDDLDFARK